MGETQMKKLIMICVVCVCLTSIACANVEDPWEDAKMHYPQLPDPYGWDVAFNDTVLADDWQCSQSGAVSDIHFWISFRGYNEPIPPAIISPTFAVSIFSDIPAGTVAPYSMPGDLLWSQIFTPDQYDVQLAGCSPQGWLNPLTQEALPEDHLAYFQVDIDFIADPFVQEEGTIYWLGLQLLSDTFPYEIGWKTSESPHFNDDAVYLLGEQGYQELVYPYNDPFGRGGQSIDLAFVITPEPTTIGLLTLGGLALLRKKH